LSYGAIGAPAIILITLLMGTAGALARWAVEDRYRDFLAASLYLSAAVLVRYEAVFIVGAAALYVVWHARLARGGSWQRAEGSLLAFLLPIAYTFGGWVVANWAIQGEAWHFWRNTFSHPSVLTTNVGALVSLVITVVLLCCPLAFAAVFQQLRRPLRVPRPGAPAIALLGGAILGPVLAPRMFSALSGDLFSQLTVPMAAGLACGFALIAIAAGQLLDQKAPRSQSAAGTLALAVLGLVLFGFIQRQGLGLPSSGHDALRGYVAFADNSSPERRMARKLASSLGLLQPHRTIVAGWPGFAIVLFNQQAGPPAHEHFRETLIVPGQRPPEDPPHLEARDFLLLLDGEEKATGELTFADLWRKTLSAGLLLVKLDEEGRWYLYQAQVVPRAGLLIRPQAAALLSQRPPGPCHGNTVDPDAQQYQCVHQFERCFLVEVCQESHQQYTHKRGILDDQEGGSGAILDLVGHLIVGQGGRTAPAKQPE